jgi:hypothetical protein
LKDEGWLWNLLGMRGVFTMDVFTRW